MSCVPDSPNKRLKIQIEEEPNDQLDLRQSSGDNEPNSCGICYADHGVSIRGEIDCCNHYFCFVCILEWSKHESRCPLCRQRFSTVRRPPKPGVFPSSRLVKVPVRDQVRQLSIWVSLTYKYTTHTTHTHTHYSVMQLVWVYYLNHCLLFMSFLLSIDCIIR